MRFLINCLTPPYNWNLWCSRNEKMSFSLQQTILFKHLESIGERTIYRSYNLYGKIDYSRQNSNEEEHMKKQKLFKPKTNENVPV